MSVAVQALTDDDALFSPWWIRRVLIVLSLVFRAHSKPIVVDVDHDA
jgi:hypothetical protein